MTKAKKDPTMVQTSKIYNAKLSMNQQLTGLRT